MSELVIIGGGFAGLWAAAAARRVDESMRDPSLRITLIAPEPLLVMRPRLYEAKPAQLAVDLQVPLAALDVRYLAGTATGLTLFNDGEVIDVALSTGEHVSADRLVVATGSVMIRPPVPGAATAFAVDTRTEAMAFDRRLADIATGKHPASVVVVGAGFTGIELALELRDRVAAHRHPVGLATAAAGPMVGVTAGSAAGRATAQDLRIVLVDRTAEVGPDLGPGPRPVIETALAAAGVELRLGTAVAELAPDRIAFSNGETLKVGAVVLCTGLRAAPFVASVPGVHDQQGRVLVDAHLRAPAAPHIFVAGDAAAADTGTGHMALQSCQHALQLGRVAGDNAARDLHGAPLVAYTQERYVTCLDLGRSGAVFTTGWDRQVQLTGEEAKQRKRMINTEIIYPPTDRAALIRQSALDPAER